jgi:molybdenum cofactor biosynthesis enzyme
MELTHFNKDGPSRMVDVFAKDDTQREAVAEGRIKMLPRLWR